MAAKKASREIANLTPNSTVVQVGELEVRVAGDANENRILNYIIAGQIRAIVEKQLRIFGDRDEPISPKELRDIAEAGRALAQFSAEIYQGGEPVQKEKLTESIPVETTDFSKLTEKKNDDPASAGNP